jgi:hypothetical protein
MNDKEIIAFQQEVNYYSEIEKKIELLKKQIKPLQLELKKLKDKKKEVETDITFFMRTNDFEVCNLPKTSDGQTNGALKLNIAKTNAPTTQQNVKNTLIEFFRTEGMTSKFDNMSHYDKAMSVFNYIYKDGRQKIEKVSIKKIKNEEDFEKIHEINIIYE